MWTDGISSWVHNNTIYTYILKGRILARYPVLSLGRILWALPVLWPVTLDFTTSMFYIPKHKLFMLFISI
jgi:hypothetical protein